MPTVLMIESWLQSTGWALPPLLRELGHEHVLMTRDPTLYRGHPALAEAIEVVDVETNDPAAVCERAARVASERRIEGVLTTCDYYLATAAQAAAHLGLPGAPPAAMRRCAHKHRVRAALDAARLPNPRYAVADTWPAALDAAHELVGFPLVAKPVDLNAGTSVRLVPDEANLKDSFREITAMVHNTRDQPCAGLVLLEEVLTGVEVSVEAVTVDGATTVIGITDKSVTGPPAYVESGHMFPAALAPNARAEVESFVAAALDAVGFTHGVSHTEVMLTADGPRLVEINPRQGGGYIFDLVELVTGTNPLRLVIDLALGRPAEVGTVASPLPGAAIPGGSAAVAFVMSPVAGEVLAVDGLDSVARSPDVHRLVLPLPAAAARPLDNECYLGHVVVTDAHGSGARRRVEDVMGSLRLHLGATGEHRVVAPLGFPSGFVPAHG
jgi:argininosuccinate lyase